jgi:D-sedoheptulose 7-phosphate isomerase
MQAPAFADQIEELQAVLAALHAQSAQVDAITRLISQSLAAGHVIYTCGNGGSATDAIHLAQELIGRYRSDRRPLPAVCLNTDVGALTCIGNDFGYAQIFARQLAALGRPGDVLVGFSTSGNSPNVNAAFGVARQQGLTTIGLLGKDGGAARELVEYGIIVPSQATSRVQEVHTLLVHAICEQIEHDHG